MAQINDSLLFDCLQVVLDLAVVFPRQQVDVNHVKVNYKVKMKTELVCEPIQLLSMQWRKLYRNNIPYSINADVGNMISIFIGKYYF